MVNLWVPSRGRGTPRGEILVDSVNLRFNVDLGVLEDAGIDLDSGARRELVQMLLEALATSEEQRSSRRTRALAEALLSDGS